MMDLTCAQFGLTAHRDIAPNKRIPASFPQLPVYITMLPPLFDQGQDGDFSPPQPWLQVFRSNPVHRKQSHPLWFVAREIYTMKHATSNSIYVALPFSIVFRSRSDPCPSTSHCHPPAFDVQGSGTIIRLESYLVGSSDCKELFGVK